MLLQPDEIAAALAVAGQDPYRRLWAVERKHLPDVDVARAGGWRDLTTMKRSYQQADPVTTLRVIENEPTGHTLDTTQIQAAQPQ